MRDIHPHQNPQQKIQGVERLTRPQEYSRREAGSVRTYARNPSLVLVSPSEHLKSHTFRRSFYGRWAVFLCVLIGLGFAGWQWKNAVIAQGEAGYQSLEEAARALEGKDIDTARRQLARATEHFGRGSRLLFGAQHFLPVLQYVPGLATGVSGVALLQAGVHLTAGASTLTEVVDGSLRQLAESQEKISLLELIQKNEIPLQKGNEEIQKAVALLAYVHPESLPQEKRDSFRQSEQLLPMLAQALALSVEHLDILEELLGANGPRIYLFLFQNNHELRPTGGFIGSYALLDVHAGKIRRFFVDGIFNPDGQLKENIVPPAPIQKISAGWSLHDSNWFPDFPTSAEKARFFYEKTGGPTTDGVITLTPEVLKRLLEVLGPIDLPEYGITVESTNFLPLIQEEVEMNYDKEENNPKKILGDLTGVILERLTARPDRETLFRMADTLVNLLNERHILLFARDPKAQNLIDTSGWSGRMLPTPYDYLSVIHTNINGYKTDGVIDDVVEHSVGIQPDGSVIDTVTITRTHTGGATPYEWWNKVNANYMRVYVPLGSELLSASGMTREFPSPPLDYDALGFRRDEDVLREEGRIVIHDESGTRIGEEFGKTVFGNWVYVSPGEKVTVTYRYRLPFRLAVGLAQKATAPFSVLYQKQAGTNDWQLRSRITYPDQLTPIWQSPENLVPYGRMLMHDTDLNRNVFVGAVFQSSQ